MRKSVVIPQFNTAQSRRGQNIKDAQARSRMPMKPDETQLGRAQTIIAFQGNSDPFHSTPVHITSQINGILTFERRCIFPVIQGPGSRFQAHGKGNILPSWSAFASDLLCDDMTALAFLSTTVTLMAQVSPDSYHRRLSLVHRYKSLNALQAYIRECGQPPLRVLVHFLIAEIWAENCDEVLAHLGMAKVIMESQVRESLTEIVPYLWISVVQMDIHRAALTLSRTKLPMDGWATFPFEVPLPFMDVHPDSCLRGGLRTLFIEIQHLNALHDFFVNDPSPRPAVGNLMRMRTLVLIGKAINHAVDGRDISASLALAYVLKVVSALENIPIGASSIYDAGPQMLARVRSCLDLVVQDPKLRLWILYVGALSGDEWFTRSFDEQTVLMGVHTWEICKAILSRFYLAKDEPQIHFHAIFDARLSKKILELKTGFRDIELDAA